MIAPHPEQGSVTAILQKKAAHKGWKFYTEPIEEKTNDTLEIITHRLGYKYAITTIANGSIEKLFTLQIDMINNKN